MGKAIKCGSCGLYYNASVYNTCPHCKQGGVGQTQDTNSFNAEKSHSSGGFISWLKKSKNPSKVETKEEKENVERHSNAKEEMAEGTDIPNTIPMTMPMLSDEENPQNLVKSDYMEAEQQHTEKEKTDVWQAEAKHQETVSESSERKNVVQESKTENSGETLQMSIAKRGRTVGKYIVGAESDMSTPVVGWLICVRGVYFGQSFNLKSGKNKIGRNHSMDVKLLNDQSVSRTCVASIIYDSKKSEFSIVPGESDTLCYVGGDGVYERKCLSGFEEIEFGDSEKNKFIFVPLCGASFKWSDYTAGQE